MCGIAGIYSNNQDTLPFEIRKMLYLIKHRGNDSRGIYSDQNFYLAHLRLATMDMSDHGAQPMSVDGRYWASFNGDIYNFIEIKKELQEKGIKFYTNTDTEVILQSFKKFGEQCLKKFNGEWFFVIYDNEKKEIFLSNDRFSSKPFYYYHKNNKFAFCSELKGFYGLNENVEICENNILTTPFFLIESNCKTFFKSIYQIPPGHNLTYNIKLNNLKIERWWNTIDEIPKISVNDKEQIDEYRELFQNSCELRLRTDNNIGVSLSGGIDSSSVFSVINHKFSNNENVNLNPVVFKSNTKDQSLEESAVNLCKFYDRKAIIVEEKTYTIEDIENLFSKIEMPIIYSGQMEIYKNFSKLGINIALDGNGSDEALGGLPKDLNVFLIEYLNTLNNIKKAMIATSGGDKTWKDFLEQSKLSSLDNISNSPLITDFKFDKLFINNLYANFQNKDGFKSTIWSNDLKNLDNFENSFQVLYWRVHCGFMQWIMHKWDKAAMSNTVATRSPFLDYRLVCFSLGLPSSKKIMNGQNKSILRRSMKGMMPDYIIENKLKKGLSPTNFNNKTIATKYYDEIINDSSFKSNKLWDVKKIYKDLNKKNFNIKYSTDIKNLAHIQLMINGLEKINSNCKEKYDEISSSKWLNFTKGNLVSNKMQ